MKPTTKTTMTTTETLAKEYIDRVVAISTRHGMGGRVPDDVYNRAVSDVVRAFRGISHAQTSDEAECP